MITLELSPSNLDHLVFLTEVGHFANFNHLHSIPPNSDPLTHTLKMIDGKSMFGNDYFSDRLNKNRLFP